MRKCEFKILVRYPNGTKEIEKHVGTWLAWGVYGGDSAGIIEKKDGSVVIVIDVCNIKFIDNKTTPMYPESNIIYACHSCGEKFDNYPYLHKC